MTETVKKPKAAAKPRKTAAKKAPAPAEPVSISSRHPSHEEVSELARKYWAEGGYREGHHEEDWYRAERDLRSKAS